MSQEIPDEARRVFSSKFPAHGPKFEETLSVLNSRLAEVKIGATKIDIARDSKDNVVLETAVVGSADYIISGDNDLLSLKKYKNTSIVNPDEFLKTRVK